MGHDAPVNENTFQFAWFQQSAAGFDPLPLAQSLWRDDQMHGVAVSGLLARALEHAVGVRSEEHTSELQSH